MPVANILWKSFDMFIGGLQAFIFALLTVIYFAMAGAGHGEHEDEAHDSAEDEPTEQHDPAQPELAA
jgi:F-type H+-transporting ATPase subunit a